MEREETFSIKGEEVVARIKDIIREGNIRRIIIKDKDGSVIAEFPLTIGVVGAVLAPALAAIGAATALLTECTITVVKSS